MRSAAGAAAPDGAALPDCGCPSQRRVFLFFGFGGVIAAVQKAVVPRFAAAVAWPLAEPAIAFAPLSHMLRKGFFLVHGFFMLDSNDYQAHGVIGGDVPPTGQ
jgi:hypothetical protein